MCGEVRHTERRQRHGQRCAYRRSGRGFVLYTLVLYTFLEPNNRADCNFCGLPSSTVRPTVRRSGLVSLRVCCRVSDATSQSQFRTTSVVVLDYRRDAIRLRLPSARPPAPWHVALAALRRLLPPLAPWALRAARSRQRAAPPFRATGYRCQRLDLWVSWVRL